MARDKHTQGDHNRNHWHSPPDPIYLDIYPVPLSAYLGKLDSMRHIDMPSHILYPLFEDLAGIRLDLWVSISLGAALEFGSQSDKRVKCLPVLAERETDVAISKGNAV